MTCIAYKYRLYPTAEQRQWLASMFGCCRFVWNQALGWRTSAYEADDTSLSYRDTSYGLKQIKKFYPWLKDGDSKGLQNTLRHLDTAFQNFFQKRGGYPKFKSKRKARMSYVTDNQNGTVAVGNAAVKLPKLGWVKAAIHRDPPQGMALKSATVSLDHDGRCFASILYKDDREDPTFDVSDIRPADVIGFDYKSDGFVMSSNGMVAGSPKYYRKSQKKLRHLQRMLKHKHGEQKGETPSHNCLKARRKVNRCHSKIRNQRKDFLAKLSTAIAKRYKVVCVEDLDLKAMSHHGFGNGKATLDNGYGMFLNMLEYKLSARGGRLVRVDRWFPSSQLCQCGYKNPITKDLKVRTITCPVCGRTYDRDLNAAQNIRDEGLRLMGIA